jgi:hypothetical protein
MNQDEELTILTYPRETNRRTMGVMWGRREWVYGPLGRLLLRRIGSAGCIDAPIAVLDKLSGR